MQFESIPREIEQMGIKNNEGPPRRSLKNLNRL